VEEHEAEANVNANENVNENVNGNVTGNGNATGSGNGNVPDAKRTSSAAPDAKREAMPSRVAGGLEPSQGSKVQ
jgi:hypothetical protein